MKPSLSLLLLVPLLSAGLKAAELRGVGVLGNSGEQGATLVRFGLPQAAGMGVVRDAEGALWDRGGDGVLNRYAPDGRLLATFPLPRTARQGTDDVITLSGNALLMKIADALFSLRLDAAPGTAPKPLGIQASCLSLSTHKGWAAAVKGQDIFLVNANGRTHPFAKLESPQHVYQVEITPDERVYVDLGSSRLVRFQSNGKTENISNAPSGNRFQWIGNHWFRSHGHGTIRRYDREFRANPGAVLGGNSGSFIGYVDEHGELHEPRGLAQITPEFFAASGWRGALHLLEWQPDENRMRILRRIGSIPEVRGLGLDSKGRVWFNAAHWEWSDGPTTSLRPGWQYPDAIFASTMMGNDRVVAYGRLWGNQTFWSGTMDTHPDSNQPKFSVNRFGNDKKTHLSDDTIALALTRLQGRPTMLALSTVGNCRAVFVTDDGKYVEDAGEVLLKTSSRVYGWTSLVSLGNDMLIGAADGWIIEMERDGDGWKENRRWNSWGTLPGEKFGNRIYFTLDGNMLWVSDTRRHRLLCLDRTSRRLVASFGTEDQSGNTLETLNSPTLIVARTGRAVAFDSANQRLMKFELTFP